MTFQANGVSTAIGTQLDGKLVMLNSPSPISPSVVLNLSKVLDLLILETKQSFQDGGQICNLVASSALETLALLTPAPQALTLNMPLGFIKWATTSTHQWPCLPSTPKTQLEGVTTFYSYQPTRLKLTSSSATPISPAKHLCCSKLSPITRPPTTPKPRPGTSMQAQSLSAMFICLALAVQT